ncbi:O-antigen ligase family protein [Diaminobutyricibacter tongyongensis]|uniref:O-antigen ligase family protein n=1 Tax=Leifsonia tongyongensis TaxID=1268043 RepID=A0A6L9Y020_9MICO|nr:O-antigen ligase family protein [Diaminobutyricibacter tongyongensis]NEN07029.1 O-antigen ligase family protein [Diaminobutyricibacter tongyongensis]
MSTARKPIAVGAFSTLLVFTLFAGDFWRNLLSWYGWGVIALGLVVGSVVLLVRIRPPLLWRRLPVTLALFLLLATLSIAWSDYPGASALGVFLQWVTTITALFLALCLEWPQLLRALSHAFRWILGLSLAFEFIVAAFIRHPVLPFWTDYGTEKVPQAFYWSRGLLFHGGQIQGIQGNSNLLAMVALLALVVFGIQFADGVVRRGSGIAWLVVAALTLVLTRSATVIITAVFTLVVLLFALWMRRVRPDRRRPVYLTMLASVVLGVAAVWVFSGQLLKLLGKSEDLTGRLDIWHSVTALAVQRPVFGWGWVSYWAPWVEPFKTLAVRKGVVYLQAHNAWLDVWLQLGVVGLVVFILLVATTLTRSWFFAVDRPRVAVSDTLPYRALTLLPLLLIAALIAQSAAESRMLVEAGWMLLVVVSVKTKRAAP